MSEGQQRRSRDYRPSLRLTDSQEPLICFSSAGSDVGALAQVGCSALQALLLEVGHSCPRLRHVLHTPCGGTGGNRW
jgi:hypothetical protein